MTMRPPRIELVCVGSELLMGRTSTHGAGLSRRLEGIGLALARETVVGDDPAEMRDVFAAVWRRSDAVICTGGLGPTFDDITRDIWSRLLRRRMRLRPEIAREIAARFRRRGYRMPAENRRQAYVLDGARVMENRLGTAPGQLLEDGRRVLALLPGPARELFPMVDEYLIPLLGRSAGGRARRTAVYRFHGIPESHIDERLDAVRRRETGDDRVRVTWGIIAQDYVVDVKVTAEAASSAAVEERLARIDRAVRRRFGADIFGTGEETLEESVGRLLAARGQTLAAAESCTGGLLSGAMTRLPGSSAYFMEGRVTYANRSKRRLLGVSAATLVRSGAVSAACAREMALGCRRRAGTDWSVAITGIAGPSGGTPGKPVGLVYIAVAGPRRTVCDERRLHDGREGVRRQAVLWALNRLRGELLRKG